MLSISPEMALVTDQDCERIAVCMARRAEQVKLRLAMGMIIAVAFFDLTGPVFAGVWLIAHAAIQSLEFQLGPSSPFANRLGRGRYAYVAIALVFANNALFGLFAVKEAFSGAALGSACAGLMIGGGIVNAVLVSVRSRLMVIASLIPQFVCFILLPIAVLSDGRGAREAMQITVGAGLLILASMSAWLTLSRMLANMDAAHQAAEGANRAKSSFLATMSHEIRTPLNGVLGMAQAIAKDELSERQKARLAVVTQSGEALLSIIDDILDLAKVEAGKVELEMTPFDLEALLLQTLSTFATIAADKNLRLDLEVEPAAMGSFVGDPGRIRQVVSNMIANALKFTPRGVVQITASRSSGEVRLQIADTGPGVAPEHLDRLFDKFMQADASTTRRYGGTGLGLSICLGFVRLMGGRMEARLVEPHGLAVSAILPLKRIPAPALLSPPAADSLPQASDDRPLRVLAAEDHPINQQVLVVLLEQVGISPYLVDNGAAAVEAWRRDEWDLILMDVQMPIMDGPTAARAIRAEEAASGRLPTPIVAVTANVMAHQLEEYRAAGMAMSVAKPIQLQTLLGVIDAALNAAHETASHRPVLARAS
jgi:signal transduction histidine kinase/AmiR/NasT family two-component response regulator